MLELFNLAPIYTSKRSELRLLQQQSRARLIYLRKNCIGAPGRPINTCLVNP